jgi:hypothetical protein
MGAALFVGLCFVGRGDSVKPVNTNLHASAREVLTYLDSVYQKKVLCGYNVYVHAPDDRPGAGTSSPPSKSRWRRTDRVSQYRADDTCREQDVYVALVTHGRPPIGTLCTGTAGSLTRHTFAARSLRLIRSVYPFIPPCTPVATGWAFPYCTNTYSAHCPTSRTRP